MKNRFSKLWILVIVIIPFLLMFCLHVGIALGDYFNVNINVPNVDASSWFMFSGSYLGGAMTLVGVMMTLKHERNIHQFGEELKGIDIEREKIGKIICEIDLYAPGMVFQNFCSLAITREGRYNLNEISSIRYQILEEQKKINTAKLEMESFTDIYSSFQCDGCKEPCRLPLVVQEFQKIFTQVGSKQYELLQKIDFYIYNSYNNALNKAMIIELSNVNTADSGYSKEPLIREYQSKLVPLDSKKEDIEASLKEISNYNQDEIQRLIGLSKEYIFIKKQNARKKCFKNMEG